MNIKRLFTSRLFTSPIVTFGSGPMVNTQVFHQAMQNIASKQEATIARRENALKQKATLLERRPHE